jgi:hypothetical protein
MHKNKNLPSLDRVIGSYMARAPMVREHCERCLKSARWNGNPILMIVDAAFDSIGLNYFQSVVPKVELFNQQFIVTGQVRVLEDLVKADDTELRKIWKNARSWHVARETAAHLVQVKQKKNTGDLDALIYWAKNAALSGWDKDPIGSIKGVGINTYQYLRMMGGVDTVMPDKIVKRVIYEILDKAGVKHPANDIEFVLAVEAFAPETGFRAIEICWMTWLIQSEAGLSRTEKYAALLPKI